MQLTAADLVVLLLYLAAVVGCGCAFLRRNRDAERYMAAGRSLPGWAVGLSIFGSYISSISFLANPGKAFAGDWNPMVFSLVTPLAALVAVRYFVPFYRQSGAISAYEHLEQRFGPWARTYAVACYIAMQIVRTGTILYLLALAIAPLTGWSLKPVIAGCAALMTIYTLAGGLEAVVWTGVIQSGVLIAAAVACLATLLWLIPGGAREVISLGAQHGKFGLGSTDWDWSRDTVWVMLLYGLMTHLQNFGVDQSYVQRYVTARTEREARQSIWLGAWIYVPIAAVFFFIGTSLWVYCQSQPDFCTAAGPLKPDQVLPHFIATVLPSGIKGLVIAGILAAAMDSSLNSLATLFLCDVYRRYFQPATTPRESLAVLYGATVACGAAAAGLGLFLIERPTVLDAWWELASICSGGMLGLFLLGMISKRAGPLAAALGVVTGVAVILWMSVSRYLPADWNALRYRGSPLLIIVAGTLTVLVVGLAVRLVCPARDKPRAQ